MTAGKHGAIRICGTELHLGTRYVAASQHPDRNTVLRSHGGTDRARVAPQIQEHVQMERSVYLTSLSASRSGAGIECRCNRSVRPGNEKQDYTRSTDPYDMLGQPTHVSFVPRSCKDCGCIRARNILQNGYRTPRGFDLVGSHRQFACSHTIAVAAARFPRLA